jgi:hypothetical protein
MAMNVLRVPPTYQREDSGRVPHVRVKSFSPLRRIEQSRSVTLMIDLKAKIRSPAPKPASILFEQTSSKEFKIREMIRFAWGISSFGNFMIAMADKGLVTMEFSSYPSAMEVALRLRFPEANVIHSDDTVMRN